jgi:hypothetical protein
MVFHGAAGPGDAMKHHAIFRQVGRHQRQAAVRPHATRGKPAGQRLDPGDERTHLHLAPARAVDQDDAVWIVA